MCGHNSSNESIMMHDMLVRRHSGYLYRIFTIFPFVDHRRPDEYDVASSNTPSATTTRMMMMMMRVIGHVRKLVFKTAAVML